MNKLFTANYINTDSNFGIFNLKDSQVTGIENALFSVLLNIIQRGCPTRASQYLLDNISDESPTETLHLLSHKSPDWGNLIKGSDETGQYPAKEFLYEIVPEYLPEYPFLTQIIIPEVLISDITRTESTDFQNQKVDFYLPQANLIIEIDGGQHKEITQKSLDEKRDKYLAQFNKSVIRIPAKSLTNRENIKAYIDRIRYQISQHKEIFNEYKESYDLCGDIKSIEKELQMVCAIRLQITILEMLKRGMISLHDKEWKIAIKSHETTGYEKHAIGDLMQWIKKVFTLAGVEYQRPKILVNHVKDLKKRKTGYLPIEISALTIATETNTKSNEIVFVYSIVDKETDYFTLNTADPIDYSIDGAEEENADVLNPKRAALAWIMSAIFGHEEFRKGQERIVINALKRRNTIGILPTGSGKSLCYQLSALLQPGITMCVCPIKSLMIDQNDELNEIGITRTAFISSDLSAEERIKTQNEFSKGKYLITFMSPERFQDETFRSFLLNMGNTEIGRYAYAVVDEVHCLSEWGHNFRVSYLNLIKTVKKYCSGAVIIGLTATASLRVIQNILIEFEMDDRNDIISSSSFDRPELDFKVQQTTRETKEDALFERLDYYCSHYNNLFESVGQNGRESRCGIIFTPHVNGEYGCVRVANRVASKYNADVKYYSGKRPKQWHGSDKDWDKEKRQTQDDFKRNEFTLLAATKAFGMGINKPNIRYTIHYGIPESLEALYQEAGRAGRDGRKAQCLVIYSKETEENERKLKAALYDKNNASVETIRAIVNHIGFGGEDLTRQTFLFSNGLVTLKEEIDCAGDIIEKIKNGQTILQSGARYSLDMMQKIVYHLSVIGLINDWTVDWKSKALKVYVNNYSRESLIKTALKYITAYEPEDYDRYSKRMPDTAVENYELHILKIFWEWYNENIIYSRKQALLTMDDACAEYAKDGNAEKFRARMEAYFKLDDVVDKIGEIADNPRDYFAWFDIINKKCIDKNTAKGIIMRLNRFLESYRHNTGLNYVSGVLNLIDHSFESINGRSKLEQALEVINGFDISDRKRILDDTAKVIATVDDNEVRELFAAFFIQNYELDGVETIIYRYLEDNYSLSVLVKKAMQKIFDFIGE